MAAEPAQKPAALREVPKSEALAAAAAQAQAAKPSRKPLIFKGIGALAALAILVWGIHYFIAGRFLVSTDDAFVQADFSALAAKVEGTVAELPVPENTLVKAGTVLVKLDDGDYRLAVEAARHRIDTQKASIARIGEQTAAQEANIIAAKAALTREEAAFARASTLNSKQFASAKSLEEARAARDSAAAAVTAAEAQRGVLKAQADEAQAQMRELETALAKAERDLAFTEIKAPFDGITGNRAVEPGQYVQPGTRLLALVPAGLAYVEANFKETQLSGIKPGQKAEVEVDAFDHVIEGTVESIAPASGAQFSLLPPENATGNFTKIVQRVPVRIKLENAEGLSLRPGLSAAVTIDTRE